MESTVLGILLWNTGRNHSAICTGRVGHLPCGFYLSKTTGTWPKLGKTVRDMLMLLAEGNWPLSASASFASWPKSTQMQGKQIIHPLAKRNGEQHLRKNCMYAYMHMCEFACEHIYIYTYMKLCFVKRNKYS